MRSFGATVPLAWRNLWRHPRRTLLTCSAFGIGLALLIIFLGLGDGFHDDLITAAVRLNAGHVVVEPRGARRQVGTGLTLSAAAAPRVERAVGETLSHGISGSAPRLYASGLLSSAAGAQGIEVIGVDPDREAGLSLVPDRITAGTFLGPGRGIPLVIGALLADKLRARLGTRLVLMVQAGEEIRSQLLRVRGIFRTGMTDVDSHRAYVPLGALQELLGKPGQLSQVAVFVERGRDPQRVRAALRDRMAGPDHEQVAVLTWDEALPEVAQFVVIDDAGNYVFTGLLVVIAALGVLNTVLMSVLERRREFGLLLAMGLRPGAVAGMVVVESFLLTLLSIAWGLAAGLGVNHIFAVRGFDMSFMAGTRFSVAGATVDPVVHSQLSSGRVLGSVAFALVVGLLAVLYPALRAAATQPREAMRTV